MSDDAKPAPEGIFLEYDPNDHVLRIFLPLPDGQTQTIRQSREQAMALYRALGEMLAPDYDG